MYHLYKLRGGIGMNFSKYKNKGLIFLFCLVFLFPCLAFSETVGPIEVEGLEAEVETGITIPGYSDYQGKIGEYMVFDRGVRPYWGFKGLGKISDTYLRLEGFYEDEKDQVYAVDLDVRRAVKGEFDYRRFRHWVDHDPLTIEEIAHPFIGMSDFDPDADYTFTRTLTKSWISLTCPRFPNINLHFNYREEGRYGDRQGLSTSDYWDIRAEGRPMEQTTRDYKTGVTFRKGILTIDDTFWYRTFKDKAIHKYGTLSFLEAGTIPRFERYQNTLSAKVDLPLYTSFYANYAYYYVDSKGFEEEFGKEAEIQYHSVQTKLTSSPIKNLVLSGYYRYQNVDNEDIHKWYDPDLGSAMTREVNTWAIDAVYRLLRSTSLRYGWEHETIGREDSGLEEVHYTETLRNTHRLSLNSRFSTPLLKRKAKIGIEWKRDNVLNPFMNLRSWKSSKEWGMKYPQLSCLPTDSDIVRWRFGVPLSPDLELSLDGEWGFKNFRSEREETQWKERYAQPTITLTYTPAANLSTYLSYGMLWRRSHTSFAPELLGVSYFENDIEYKEEEHNWTVGLNYQVMADLSFSGYFTYIRQDARFDTAGLSGTDFDTLVDLGKSSTHNIHTCEFSLACDYRISKSLFANAQFIYEQFDNDFDDDPTNVLYGTNGTGYMGLLGISWRPF